MTIMSAQAVAHGMHRKDSPQDIVIFGVIGVTLLALLPADKNLVTGTCERFDIARGGPG
jgi:hypothetical protein